MTRKKTDKERASELRRNAEEIAREPSTWTPAGTGSEALSLDETSRLLHELQVHQIELEMQNEELRQAQQELEASRTRYFDIYDLAPVGYLILGKDGMILEANLTAASMLGLTRNRLANYSFLLFILREDRILYQQQWIKFSETGSPQGCELRMKRKDGSQFWAQVELSQSRDAEGESAQRVVISDISEHKRAEEAIASLALRNQILLNTASDGIHILDQQGNLIEVNPAFCRMLGYSSAELLKLNVADWSAEWSRPELLARIRELIAHPATFETRIRRKDGTLVYVEISASAVMLDGRSCLYTSARDITERKQAEIQKQEALDRLQKIANRVPGVVYQYRLRPDGSSCFPFSSEGMREIYRINPEDVREDASAVFANLHPDDYAGVVDSIQTSARDLTLWKYEYRVKFKDGTIRSLYGNSMPEREPDGSTLWHGLIVDITERKLAEDRLRSSEQKYRDMFEKNTAVKLIVNPRSGAIVKANRAAASFYGYSVDQLEKMKVSKINILPEQQIKAEMALAMSEERNYFHFRHRLASGEIRDVEIFSGPIEVDGIVLLYSIIHDITDRKRAEEALHTNEERLRMIFETLSEGVALNEMVFDADGAALDYRILEVNNAFYRVADFRKEGPVVGSMATQVYGMDVQTIRSFWEKHKKVSETQYTEFISPISHRKFAIFTSPLFNNRFITSFQDITERKQAELALDNSRWRMESILEGTNAGTWEWNVQTGETVFNEKWAQIIGYTLAELAPISIKTWERFSHPDDLKQSNELLEKHFTGELPNYHHESRMQHKDGHWVWVLDSGRVITHTSEGKPLMMFGTHQEITERKQAEAELSQANARLEERVASRTAELQKANQQLLQASRMKDEFLASMSHELRTPLTGILGLSDVLQLDTYGALSDKQRVAIGHIHSSGHHLLELINDILDLSKLEAGKFELELQPCSLDVICQESLQMTSVQAAAKNLQSSISINPVDIILRADARRVKQIILNMLSNAVKFTPKDGSYGIQVTGNPQQQQVLITVWDTGIGIKEEDKPRLFQSFVQLDARLSRQYSGTGLGLALVRRLTELHGGSVMVESVFGQGSRFTVSLPWIK